MAGTNDVSSEATIPPRPRGSEITVKSILAGMIFRALTVYGSNTGCPDDLRAVLALANSGKLAPTPLQHFHHDQANEAMQSLYAGKITGRAILDWA